MVKVVTEDLTDLDSIRNILEIVRDLFNRGLFSASIENVVLERADREPIFPCGGYSLDEIDLSHLEWAAREKQFWFLGPIRCLKIIFDRGPMQGTLELEYNRMQFTTSLCTLNYKDFNSVAQKLREMAKQLRIKLDFQSISNYQIKLTIESPAIFSSDAVKSFIDKISSLQNSTDDL